MYLVIRDIEGERFYLRLNDDLISWTKDINEAAVFDHDTALRECRNYHGRQPCYAPDLGPPGWRAASG
jgi:hypothetical protein